MDPIGTTASLLTLVELAVKTVKLVNHATHSYRYAPTELTRLKDQLDGFKSQLSLLRLLKDALLVDDLRLGEPQVTNTLAQFINHAIQGLHSIHDHFERQIVSTRINIKGRLKLALQDASKFKNWETEVRKHSSDLSNILLLLNL